MVDERAPGELERARAGSRRGFYRRLQPTLVLAGKQFAREGFLWTAVDPTGVDLLATVALGSRWSQTGQFAGPGSRLRAVGQILCPHRSFRRSGTPRRFSITRGSEIRALSRPVHGRGRGGAAHKRVLADRPDREFH